MNIFKSIETFKNEMQSRPFDATGYDLNIGRFVKREGVVDFYYYIPSKRWTTYTAKNDANLVIPIHDTFLKNILEVMTLLPTQESVLIYLDEQLKIYNFLNAV
ncbi:hypothetical protein N5D44_11005 [Acinetobacter junii]|uniref:hypothetical protein n=1 Tax=Acinetobacter junii TaxID=40215 RepID=UPI00195B244B|nr:hypothetical protein [Acinetobacter junii]MDH1858818.1 hypothetical protein [Acinetobacter junii]VTX53315.1 Uncharacterised protein [Acinetobacter junii]